MNTAEDLSTKAKSLYWQAFSITQISKEIGVSINTIYSWRRRYEWDKATPMQRVQDRTHVRYLRLVEKDDKTPKDFKEIDLLARQLYRFERHERRDQEKEKKAKTPKNHFTEEQITQLRALIFDSLYEHQKRWFKQWNRRNRFILKSRQIGATWYFAREALLRALETGNNQIFLSASRAQAFQFKRFIQKLAREIGVELKGGDAIELSNGAILYFLGTSAATAQSYTGDLYLDEAFWISNFIKLRSVAAGMATQKGLRRTYFSTPSSEEHEAYPFWTGDQFNESRRRSDRVDIDTSYKALKNGKLCGDNIWRQIVTLEDAMKLGFDLVDIDEIRSENSLDEYANLYGCTFVKAGERAFDYNTILGCGVDGYMPDAWPDWNPFAPRPLGNRPVWVSYDPNGSSGKGDSAGLVVLAPPAVPGGKFRAVERHQLRGMEYEEQAKFIKEITTRYNVQHIAIDGTGIGDAVYQLVIKFFPQAVKYNYSPVLKRSMVLKMLMVIRAGRFEFDAGMMDLAQSFMTVRKVTAGGVITYQSDRARGSNHGDLAWATMQGIYNEPIGAEVTGDNGSFVEEF
ncbi:terminase large subunit domain-containing protein [Citrobacter freundii]|uniref:terminase large subunit domain-containing protein n=1 Tax=Citrobacter freundii TaxID=546 RepID=UPI0015F9B79D|nr:terminase family protein [Citrobacter freundii]MBA7950976.1 oxidoreductase [Citrobacter freundii]HBC8831961.1 terminase family protein [Citrobacter freundii]